MFDIEALLLEGVRHQQAGRLAQAEAAYREVLEFRADHPRALVCSACATTSRTKRPGCCFESGRSAGISWISLQVGPRAGEAARHGAYV
jgi:hypothetical protein